MSVRKHTQILFSFVFFYICFGIIAFTNAMAGDIAGNYTSTLILNQAGLPYTISADSTVTTSGLLGVNVQNNVISDLSAKKLAVSVTGNNIYALNVTGTGNNLTLAGSLSTTGTSAYALYIANNRASTLTFIGDITTSGEGGHAVRVGSDYNSAIEAQGSTVNTTGTIRTTGKDANGIKVEGKGNVINHTGNIITTGASDAFGVNSKEGSVVTVTGDITTSGNAADGIRVDMSTVTVVGNVTTKGTADAHGINIDGGTVTVTGDVTTSGSGSLGVGAFGIYAKKNGTERATVTVDGNVTTGGAAARAVSADNSDVIVTGNIKTSGSGFLYYSDGVYATNGTVGVGGNITTEGNSSYGVRASSSSTVTVADGISTKGNSAIAAYAASAAKVTITGDVTTAGTTAHGLSVTGANSNITMQDGTLKVANNNTSWHMVTAANGSITLSNVVVNDDSLNLLQANASTLVNATNSSLKGNIVQTGGAGGILTTNLTNTILTGTVNATHATQGQINLALQNSIWNVTGNSSTRGTLTMGATTLLDYSTAALGTIVSVTDLSGGGSLIMKADIPTEVGDRLVASGVTDGAYNVSVANSGSAATTGTERVILIETADKNSSFTLANKIDAGAFKYDLRVNNDGNGRFDAVDGQYWELFSTGASNAGSAAVNTFIGNYMLAYAMTDTLIQRLGDLRGDMQCGQNGLWVRGFGGEFNSDARDYVYEFDMSYWGVQVGYDFNVAKNCLRSGSLYTGVFFGFSEADLDFDQAGRGSGDIQQQMAGLYATYVDKNGYYADFVAKYVWARNEFDTTDSAGEAVNGGRVHTRGIGLSLETGHEFGLMKQDL